MNKKVKEELQRRMLLKNDELKWLLNQGFPEKYLEFAYHVLNLGDIPNVYEGDFRLYGGKWQYDIGDNWWYDLDTDLPRKKIKYDGTPYIVECQGCGREILSDESFVRNISYERKWDELIEQFSEEYVDYMIKKDPHYFDHFFEPIYLKRIYCEDCYKLSGGK